MDQIWAWLPRRHRLAVGVRDPLKSSVTGPSLMVNCYLETKFHKKIMVNPPPPPLKYVYEYINCFTDILVNFLQYVSACISLTSRETGVCNRGRMVPGNWLVVGVELNVDSCFLSLSQFVCPGILTVHISPHSSHLSSQFKSLPTVHISLHSSNFSSQSTSLPTVHISHRSLNVSPQFKFLLTVHISPRSLNVSPQFTSLLTVQISPPSSHLSATDPHFSPTTHHTTHLSHYIYSLYRHALYLSHIYIC